MEVTKIILVILIIWAGLPSFPARRAAEHEIDTKKQKPRKIHTSM
jgi:hypothetical protein